MVGHWIGQCWSMLVMVGQYWSMLVNVGQWLVNDWSILVNVGHGWSMLVMIGHWIGHCVWQCGRGTETSMIDQWSKQWSKQCQCRGDGGRWVPPNRPIDTIIDLKWRLPCTSPTLPNHCIAHCYPLLPIVTHCYPLLPIVTHWMIQCALINAWNINDWPMIKTMIKTMPM